MGYSKQWNELMDKVCLFQDVSTPAPWYRGHAKNTYKLHSGMFRKLIENEIDDIEKIRFYERNLYAHFSKLGANLLTDRGWNQLFIMQHHGVKTRLLDWTESFAVALYFAYSGWNQEEDNARIWLVDPIRLNLFLRKEEHIIAFIDDLEYEQLILQDKRYITLKTGAVMPSRKNTRLIAQLGVFTVQGNNLLPLEEECNGDLIKNNVLTYVDITPNMVYDVERYLRQNGINHFSLFPDLQGLAKYLEESEF